jgi:hypothetical protein
MAAKEGRHNRREPARRRLAEPLTLAAERLFECDGRLEFDADARGDQLHRLQRAPLRNRQKLLACSAATQQEFVPIQGLKRLGDPLRRGRGRPVDAAIGVERGPDGRRTKAEHDDEKQTGDKLKHKTHAITPKFAKVSLTTPPRLANCGDRQDGSSGKFPKPNWAWLFGPGAAALI